MGMTRLEGFSLHRLLHASVDPAPVIGDILFCGGHENHLENRYERPASPNMHPRSPDHLLVESRDLSSAFQASDCTVPAAHYATACISTVRPPVIIPAASLIYTFPSLLFA